MSWGDVADLGTAFGTLVLAVATFLSVLSANRAARIADRALQKGLRPILLPSLYTEPVQKIHYFDDHWLKVPGSRAALDLTPDVAYLALSVRNVGSGPAVIDAWDVHALRTEDHRPVEGYHFLGRDLYIAAGSTGYVQVAVRDPTSPPTRSSPPEPGSTHP